jgi:DNA-3-methyladenine glycosylase II
MSDEEVITELTRVKGIGKWTAEMILIFSLARPDVFSLGDLGLRNAVSKLYNVDRDDVKRIEEISLIWKPMRSTASRYLWRSLDNKPAISVEESQ